MQPEDFDPIPERESQENDEQPNSLASEPPFATAPQSLDYPPVLPSLSNAPARLTQRIPWMWVFRVAALLAILATGVGIGVISASRSTSPKSSATTSATTTITTSNASLSLPATVQDLQQTIITVVHTVQPSVVEVNSTGSNGSAIGSGEFLTKSGYIVTNDHVVAGFTSYTVTLSNGTTQSAQLVGEDAQDDLAVLKTNIQNATPITLANSSQAQIGEFVVALGAPLGLQQSATFGIVSALNRTEQESGSSGVLGASSTGPVLTGLIQTSAPINPGNSGGALVDLEGRLIGIPTLGASGQSQGETISGIGFAIPANRVLVIADQLMQQGRVTSSGQGFLGVQGQDVTASSGLSVQQGVQIMGFSQDASGASPAQSAGLQTGDIIVAVNGQPVTDSADLAGVIFDQAPGTKVSITVMRGSSSLTLSVTLGERPVSS